MPSKNPKKNPVGLIRTDNFFVLPLAYNSELSPCSTCSLPPEQFATFLVGLLTKYGWVCTNYCIWSEIGTYLHFLAFLQHQDVSYSNFRRLGQPASRPWQLPVFLRTQECGVAEQVQVYIQQRLESETQLALYLFPCLS